MGTPVKMDNFDSDKVLLKILDELQNDHDCHTVILYGSRTRGDADHQSDYDLVALRDKEPNLSVAKVIDGLFIDAWVYADSYVDKHLVEFLRLRGGRVLFQRGNQGTKLLSQAEALYRKGPMPLRADEIQQRKTWIDKSFQRVLRGDVEGLYRRHWLLFNLLEDYFALRGLWYRGPKESFRYLEEFDARALRYFEAALAPNAKEADVKKLCELVKSTSP